MKLNLTDGKSKFTFIIDEDDPEQAHKVRTSKYPVRTAMQIIKHRIGPEFFNGLFPIATGVALEGMQA